MDSALIFTFPASALIVPESISEEVWALFLNSAMFPLIDARPPEPCLASVAAVILFFAMTDISPF